MKRYEITYWDTRRTRTVIANGLTEKYKVYLTKSGVKTLEKRIPKYAHVLSLEDIHTT